MRAACLQKEAEAGQGRMLDAGCVRCAAMCRCSDVPIPFHITCVRVCAVPPKRPATPILPPSLPPVPIAPLPSSKKEKKKERKCLRVSMSSSSAPVPRPRPVEFRSVLRLRPGGGGEKVLLLSSPPRPGAGAGAWAGAGAQSSLAVAELRRPSDGGGRAGRAAGAAAAAAATAAAGGGGGGGGGGASVLHHGISVLTRGIPIPNSNSNSNSNSNRGSEAEEEAEAFRFDAALGPDADQADAYGQIGMVAALDATAPLMVGGMGQQQDSMGRIRDHVVVCLGPAGGGRTHTALGPGGEEQGQEEDGLVPRLLRDLYGQHGRSPSLFRADGRAGLDFAVQLTMVHVHGDRVYDMLSTSVAGNGNGNGAGAGAGNGNGNGAPPASGSAPSSVQKMIASMEGGGGGRQGGTEGGGGPGGGIEEVRLVKSSRTGLYRADANVETCRTYEEARETLYDGLDEVVVAAGGGGVRRSRGHTVVTVRPVLLARAGAGARVAREGARVAREGAAVTVVDLAAPDREAPGPRGGGGAAGRTDTAAAVLACRGAVRRAAAPAASMEGTKGRQKRQKQGQPPLKEQIPYRHNKVTALLQQHCSRAKGSEERETVATLVVAASQGAEDYAEKRALLGAVEALRGLSPDGTGTGTGTGTHPAGTEADCGILDGTPRRVPPPPPTRPCPPTRLQSPGAGSSCPRPASARIRTPSTTRRTPPSPPPRPGRSTDRPGGTPRWRQRRQLWPTPFRDEEAARA